MVKTSSRLGFMIQLNAKGQTIYFYSYPNVHTICNKF